MVRLSKFDIESLTTRYCASASTIRRIQRNGLDPRDPRQVATWILDRRQIKPAMVNAVARELQQLDEISE